MSKEIKLECPYCQHELVFNVEQVDALAEDEIKVTISQADECNLFRAVIDSYGIKASYGAGLTMSINEPFVDSDDCFRNGVKLYTQTEIAPFWKAVHKGEFCFDENNDRVKDLIANGVLDNPYSY